MNLPKFTSDDLPLFHGITSDLFPGATIPPSNHASLIPQVHEICKTQKKPLLVTQNFEQKIIQLYETVLVRHGLMVVGATGSGKTCVVHTLAAAMTECEEFENVHIWTMNPKSITSGLFVCCVDCVLGVLNI